MWILRTKGYDEEIMFRNNEYPEHTENVNILLSNSGMGDCLCSLIPIDYIKKNIPYINPLVWTPDYLVEFAKHVLPKGTVVRSYSQANKKYNAKLTAVSNRWDKGISAMRIHPVDHAYMFFLDMLPSMKDKNYLKIRPEEIDISKFNLPEKYIVIPVGSTAKPKELSNHIINNISKYALIKGYKPIYLGFKENHLKSTLADIDYTMGIDLTEKTSVLEASAIMANSKCVIGMDGGLIHLAAFSNVPIIASYTFVNPELIMPIRNGIIGYNMYTITPSEDLECRFCQSNWLMMYDYDFVECKYEDYLCSVNLKFEQFKEKMDIIL